MFWRMAGLSTASPVESILDKDNYTLEELLDEDEIIQECKALNGRLINFLRERAQVEQLLQYIVEEAPEDAEKKRTFKFPFIACEIFTCEVDIILKTLVEDEELMSLLFSFLKPEHSHGTLLAGYFSKVVICLMLRKTLPFMNFVQAHQEIFHQLVDLIGITSIMEVLIRLIGADEHMYSNYLDAMQWLEETNVLEMIVDKFSSSDSPEVHANAAETLCAITRYAPSGLAAKIASPSFVGRLFRHALEESRPKSVLVHSLSICISLLDPKRSSTIPYHQFRGQQTLGPAITASPETVEGMLGSIGELLKLLDVSSSDSMLQTTYGKLQPPLGKHRLKIVEFFSVLLTVGSEAAEKEVIQQGAIKRILDMFFEYPYNNFLHHHVENIIVSCLESKKSLLIDHLLQDCDIVGRILETERNSTLSTDSNKPAVPAEGKSPPRIGNIGHLTRISNKLIQLGNNNSQVQQYLQDNSEWHDWYSNVLVKRNAVENVYQWACGRPTALQDRTRDSDDEDFRDRDYDVAALASNLSQAFHYGIYNNDDIEDVAHGSLERDDEDVYFDDESAEVVISSLRLGDDQESGSLFTNSNWFAFGDDRAANESLGDSLSPSPSTEQAAITGSSGDDDEVIVGGEDELVDTATSSQGERSLNPNELSENGLTGDSKEDTSLPLNPNDADKPLEWVEWRETLHAVESPSAIPNGEVEVDSKGLPGSEADVSSAEPSVSTCDVVNGDNADVGGSDANPDSKPQLLESTDGKNPTSDSSASTTEAVQCGEGTTEPETSNNGDENA
ncbi:uncharacterized protein [Aristolochia californica]|uniref:uncharacterized protein n=1 Tax=Aristolochia californica TaxID=171875 RepID=UPI0035D7B605